jgi:hypothetical protein
MATISDTALAVPKPDANEILLFADCLSATPTADRKVAAEALQKWIDGTLTQDDATQYRASLQFPQRDSIATLNNSTECALCLAACCGFFGCNPACVAGCVAGICK